jgi:hypothetical protein
MTLISSIACVLRDYPVGSRKLWQNHRSNILWRCGLGIAKAQSDQNVWRSHTGQSAGISAVGVANAAVPTGNTGAADRMWQLGLEISASERSYPMCHSAGKSRISELSRLHLCWAFPELRRTKDYAATGEQTNARHGRQPRNSRLFITDHS